MYGYGNMQQYGYGTSQMQSDAPTWAASGLTALSLICAAFGNSLRPISPLAWFQPIFLLLAMKQIPLLFPRAWQRAATVILMIMLHALCSTLAFAGFYSSPRYSLAGLALVFMFCTVMWTVMVVGSFWTHVIFIQRYPKSTLHAFIFPVTWCACWTALTETGLTGSWNPSYALLDYLPLAQLAALLGLTGLTYLHGWLTALVDLCTDEQRLHSIAGHCAVFGTFTLILTSIASARLHNTAFSQNGESALGYLQASCITASADSFNSSEMSHLWDVTLSRVEAKDNIILWTEHAVLVDSDSAEQQLLDQAEKAVQGTHTYLGLTYEATFDEPSSNFVLMSPSGVKFLYRKSHPIFAIESMSHRGPEVLALASSPYGTLAGALGSDLDFPELIRQAGTAGAAILLQPAWSWGETGPWWFRNNALRAVENGFTLFRCSNEVGGFIDPYFQTLHRFQPGAVDVFTAVLRRPRHVFTLYPHAGYLFQWVTLLAAVAVWLSLLLPWHLLPRRSLRAAESQPLLAYGVPGDSPYQAF